jgi:tetratricopeptide (TPR) repeat protein
MANTELRKNPRNHIAWVLLGDVYYSEGEYTKSMEYYKRAYNIFPTVENVSDYGLSVAALGKANGGDKASFQLAYNLFNEVVRLKPDPFIYYVIGDLLYDYTVTYKLLNPNKLQSALSALDYSLSLYQSDIAFIKRGEVKAAMNDIGSALVDYENAIKIDPQYYKAYYLRGKLRAFNFGNLEAGLEDEEKALRLVGNNPHVKADILSVQAFIYYQLAYKTGNRNLLTSSFDKLGEAYTLTENEAYLEIKQQMEDELNKPKQGKKK